jgi:hypothetical protein
MGCDTYIKLPPDARVRDVAKVMAALAGYKKTKTDLSHGICWATEVEGFTVSNCSFPVGMVTIHLDLPTLDGEEHHMCWYHFEGDEKGNHTLVATSTPFWVALGLKLIKFFGGTVDYNDCEGEGADVTLPRPRPTNFACDGDEWTDFQQDILDVEPVTKMDIVKAAKHAAYNDPDAFPYLAQFKEEHEDMMVEEMVDNMIGPEEE